MRQYTSREFFRILIANGFTFERHNGDHAIFYKNGRHISVPETLSSVIARRLIKENNLETDIKKLKKNKRMSEFNDNIPIGADIEEAPWNEPLDVKHKRFVSVTLSFYTEVEGSPDMREDAIRESVMKDIHDGNIPEEYDIDELIILDE